MRFVLFRKNKIDLMQNYAAAIMYINIANCIVNLTLHVLKNSLLVSIDFVPIEKHCFADW